MPEKILNNWQKYWFVWIGLFLIAAPVTIYFWYWIPSHDKLSSLGTMAEITLITSTIGFFLIESYDKSVLSFGEGEIRKGITFSIIALFFGLVAYGNGVKVEDGSILSKVLENFWIVVSSVIAFYFGSRAVETYADKKYETAEDTVGNGGAGTEVH